MNFLRNLLPGRRRRENDIQELAIRFTLRQLKIAGRSVDPEVRAELLAQNEQAFRQILERERGNFDRAKESFLRSRGTREDDLPPLPT